MPAQDDFTDEVLRDSVAPESRAELVQAWLVHLIAGVCALEIVNLEDT